MRAATWWIDRWRKSTAYTDMTLAAQGAYRNLLDECWLRPGGIIPADDRILAKIAGGTPEEWASVRDVVLARFLPVAGGYVNETASAVIEQTEEYRASKASAGRSRWASMTEEQRRAFVRAGVDARNKQNKHDDKQTDKQDNKPPGPGPDGSSSSLFQTQTRAREGFPDFGPRPPDSGGLRMRALAQERSDLVARLRAKGASGTPLTPTEARLLAEAEGWLAKMLGTSSTGSTNGAARH